LAENPQMINMMSMKFWKLTRIVAVGVVSADRGLHYVHHDNGTHADTHEHHDGETERDHEFRRKLKELKEFPSVRGFSQGIK